MWLRAWKQALIDTGRVRLDNGAVLRLVISRLIQLPVVVGLIFAATFCLAWVIPGNPLERPEGQRPPAEVQQAMLRQYNLHDPWSFAAGYLKGVLLRGDFGPSLQYRDQRVSQIVAEGLAVSLPLGVAALVFALALGLAAGIVGAVRPGSAADLVGLTLALVGVSFPAFVTGSVLMVVFAGLLKWLPVGGWSGPGHVILPAVTLGAAPAAYIARLIRVGLVEILRSDFIRTARAKGLPGHRVVLRHALKVAFLPVLSFLGPAAAAVMTGSFVVEKVFAVPGLGDHFVNAVLNKDQFLILGVVLVYAVILVVFNLLVDVAYAWVDPRIELG